MNRGNATLSLLPANPLLWSPDQPTLYMLEIRLEDERGTLLDCVTQKIGLREIRVEGTQLLLNGQPLELRGFGKHEDSPLHGRGLNLPQMVKDFRAAQMDRREFGADLALSLCRGISRHGR